MRGLLYVAATLIAVAVVVALLYLAWQTIRLAMQARGRRRDELARQRARWEVFTEPCAAGVYVGLVRVARTRAGREVLDRQILETIPPTAPDYEIHIATAAIRARADMLNDGTL